MSIVLQNLFDAICDEEMAIEKAKTPVTKLAEIAFDNVPSAGIFLNLNSMCRLYWKRYD